MYFRLNEVVKYRQLDDQFIVYSGATNETLLVHFYAYKMIELLETGLQSVEGLREVFNEVETDKEQQGFIRTTIEQFLSLGIIEKTH